MRRLVAVVSLVAAVVLLVWQSTNPVLGDEPHVLVIDIDGAIEPLTADHIARGIDKARDDGASLVVIRLDTPGGLVDSTREIVERLLETPVPVAVYVSPAGARAGSAGTFVTAAANFAVMAPGTNIGAASVVGAGGMDLPETLARKIDEDTRAFIRSNCRHPGPQRRGPGRHRVAGSGLLGARGPRPQRHRPHRSRYGDDARAA